MRSGATHGEIKRKFGVGRQNGFTNWRKKPPHLKTHAKHRAKYRKARDLLDAGLTRTATAEKLGVSRDALRKWEKEGRLPPSYAEKRASGAITGPLLLRDEDFRVLYGQFKNDAAMALKMQVEVGDVVAWRERNGLPERIPPPKEQMSRNDHAALKRKMARDYWNEMMKWGVVANPELTLVDVFDYIRGGIMEQDYHVSRVWVRRWYENTLVPFGWPSIHGKRLGGLRKSKVAHKTVLRLMAEEGLKG